MNQSIAEKVSALARQAVSEQKDALKIIIVENGALTSSVKDLLIKVHEIPKNNIVLLGPTLDDNILHILLKHKKPFVVVSKDFINNRPCVFHAPSSRKIIAISFIDDEIDSMQFYCESETLQFKPGWFV